MDPSTAELAAFANLADAVAWVGLADDVLNALREAIGDFQILQEVVLIPRPAWDAAVGATRVPAADAAQPARPFRALEFG